MKKKAIVAGATGIIGGYIFNHLLQEKDWDVIGLARSIPNKNKEKYISLDLNDSQDCLNKLGNLKDITHIFYAAYQDFPAFSKEQISINLSMMKNVVTSLDQSKSPLERVVMMQGAKVYGAHIGKFKTPAKEDDPRHMPPNFYFDQEDFLAEYSKDKSWDYCVLRPDVVAGISYGKPMNLAMVIGVYACISKHLGLPLKFPGNEGAYEALAQMTDSTLLAKATIWAGQDENASNEIFNVTNGDFFRWKYLWKAVADFFDMPLGDVQSLPLAEIMPLQKSIWEDIKEKYKLKDIAYENLAAWSFGDFILNCDYDVMSDTTKIKHYGFTDVQDTQEMLLNLFRQLQEEKVLPRF